MHTCGLYLALLIPLGVMHQTTLNILRPFFKNGPSSASFAFIFVFSANITILTKIYAEKCFVHPVYGAGIQTNNLQNMSLNLPLDQGSRFQQFWSVQMKHYIAFGNG